MMKMKISQKYGLQVRTKPQKISLPIFGLDDEEYNDIEKEISRQATKTKSLKETEEQHKKALEQDPCAFAYDEVYDDMKQQALVPKVQKPEVRYVSGLMKQAERRKKESEIAYSRKIVKEIEKDAHLYHDKPRFVTGSYKRKLEAEKKWIAEETLREEKDDVTKKKDLSEFYFNIGKNVAFGAPDTRETRLEEHRKAEKETEKVVIPESKGIGSTSRTSVECSERDTKDAPRAYKRMRREEHRKAEKEIDSSEKVVTPESKSIGSTSRPSVECSERDSKDVPRAYKRMRPEDVKDAIAAAKERLLARKMANTENTSATSA